MIASILKPHSVGYSALFNASALSDTIWGLSEAMLAVGLKVVNVNNDKDLIKRRKKWQKVEKNW